MTNEESNKLVEWYRALEPAPSDRVQDLLCLLQDNAALTDEDRDHLIEEIETDYQDDLSAAALEGAEA